METSTLTIGDCKFNLILGAYDHVCIVFRCIGSISAIIRRPLSMECTLACYAYSNAVHLREPLTLACVAERLAKELSLPI